MPGQPGIDLAIPPTPKVPTAMAVAGQPAICNARGNQEPLVTGFEDADSPGAITAADFGTSMAPVPDPLNDAPPVDVEVGNTVATDHRPMPSYIDTSLQEDAGGYLQPPAMPFPEHNSGAGGSTGNRQEQHDQPHPHVVSPVPHQPIPGMGGFSLAHPAGIPPGYFHSLVQHIPQSGSPSRTTASHMSPPPPMPNLMQSVLHPLDVSGHHFPPPHLMQPSFAGLMPNMYQFEFGGPPVVLSPGEPIRHMAGGAHAHYAPEDDAVQSAASRLASSSRKAETAPQPKKPEGIRKPRRLRGQKARPPNPSRFCHICLRRGERVKLKSCYNLASKSCRKVTCEKCFEDFKWDWAAACQPGSQWTCTHCRKVCPERAQCFIYKRTNNRRHQALMEKKARQGGGSAEMSAQDLELHYGMSNMQHSGDGHSSGTRSDIDPATPEHVASPGMP